MISDPIDVPFEPPDPDVAWENCLETCRRASVKPVPRETADRLIAERTEPIAAAITTPTQH